MRLNILKASLILALLATSLASIGAAPVENGGRGPLDRTVFVHYPGHQPPNRGKPGPGGTGTLDPDYKYSGVRWANPVVSYYVKALGSGVSDAVAAVTASFLTWDNASKDLSFVYSGDIGKAAGSLDGYNVVSWADITKDYPGAIAVTFIWSYRYSKQIAEVDTIMNRGTGFMWSYTPPDVTHDLSDAAAAVSSRYTDPTNSGTSGTYDIRDIMTHEAGHWIMLGDLYNSSDSKLTMYGYGSMGEIAKDTLGYGDELGVEKAYGP